MRSDTIPLALQTLFADLAQQVETAPRAGSVYRRTLEASDYIYAKVPVGTVRLDVFVGRSGDPTAEARAHQFQTGSSLSVERRTIVSLLRRQGLSGPDRVMGAILDALSYAGLFEAGAVLVGTAAYLMCEPLVGRRLPASSLITGDLDLATASLAIEAEPPEGLLAILRRADPTFEGLPQLRPQSPSSRFRSASGYLVDLVTPTRTRDDQNPLPLASLGAGAAPLQHLAWLIDGSVRTVALWGGGVMVNVPQPARLAVHKLILAQRRDPAHRVKRTKDLLQAKSLIESLLLHDPFAIKDALADARGQGAAGWATPIERSLRELDLESVAED